VPATGQAVLASRIDRLLAAEALGEGRSR
jgi:hypothetical protein